MIAQRPETDGLALFSRLDRSTALAYSASILTERSVSCNGQSVPAFGQLHLWRQPKATITKGVSVSRLPETDEGRTTRKRILAVATELFGAAGFDSVSVSDIADAGGISTSLIYYHFEDKQSLYQAIAADGVATMRAALLPMLESADSPEHRLRRFVSNHIAATFERESIMRVLVRAVTDMRGPVPDAILAHTTEMVSALASVIEEGIADGAFRPTDSRLAAACLFGLINIHITARVLDVSVVGKGAVDAEELAGFVCDLFLGGMRVC